MLFFWMSTTTTTMSSSTTIQHALASQGRFDQTFDTVDARARIVRLVVWYDASHRRQVFEFTLRRPLTPAEEAAVEQQCYQLASQNKAAAADHIQVAFVPQLATTSSTGEVFWSLNAIGNVTRKRIDGLLPAVVHTFRQLPVLKTLLATLGGYDPDAIRAQVVEYNTLLKQVEDWQDAKARLELGSQQAVIDAHLQEVRPKLQELWQRIIRADQTFIDALKAKPDLAGDKSSSALQELYRNARERTQQATSTLQTRAVAATRLAATTAAECACSLSDLTDDQLRKKPVTTTSRPTA